MGGLGSKGMPDLAPGAHGARDVPAVLQHGRALADGHQHQRAQRAPPQRQALHHVQAAQRITTPGGACPHHTPCEEQAGMRLGVLMVMHGSHMHSARKMGYSAMAKTSLQGAAMAGPSTQRMMKLQLLVCTRPYVQGTVCQVEPRACLVMMWWPMKRLSPGV